MLPRDILSTAKSYQSVSFTATGRTGTGGLIATSKGAWPYSLLTLSGNQRITLADLVVSCEQETEAFSEVLAKRLAFFGVEPTALQLLRIRCSADSDDFGHVIICQLVVGFLAHEISVHSILLSCWRFANLGAIIMASRQLVKRF